MSCQLWGISCPSPFGTRAQSNSGSLVRQSPTRTEIGFSFIYYEILLYRYIHHTPGRRLFLARIAAC